MESLYSSAGMANARENARPADLRMQFDLADAQIELTVERMFDDLPDVVFFIKDTAGRYARVNNTLAERCGFASKSLLIGKRPSDLFPVAMAAGYERQDLRVMQAGRAVVNLLEIHFYPSGRRGWCITNKYPVRSRTTGA